MHPSYNVRNNEIGAIIGINQLKRLDKNNIKRNKNLSLFLKLIHFSKYYVSYDLRGCSYYAFPIILKTKNLRKRDMFESILNKNGIEFRRGNAGGGNQLRQPYLRNYVKKINFKKFKNVEHVHFFGYYIGNFPNLSENKIKQICSILNKISFT
jgi:CDP-6-deoxy-D-xylo-4-hexulose-3-dehydrase